MNEIVTRLAAALRHAEQSRALDRADRRRVGRCRRGLCGAGGEYEQAFLHAGRRLSGRKIGLTAVSVQKQLGVDQPDYGMLFADMEVADGDEIPLPALIQPKVEVEIAFIMGRKLALPDPTSPEVLAAVEWAVPALESIVDSRIANWKISISRYDRGQRVIRPLCSCRAPARRIEELDLRLCGMVLERNGDPQSFGAGIACLGHPLHSLRWLAGVMARAGRPLGPGDVALSGALGPMVTAVPGDRFEARVQRAWRGFCSFR